MIVYWDVSCMNRPFDDREQPRIRLEIEAIALVLEQIENGTFTPSHPAWLKSNRRHQRS
jgi:hypothetical protein